MAPWPIVQPTIFAGEPGNDDVLLIVLSTGDVGVSGQWAAYTAQSAGWKGLIAVDVAVRCGAGRPTDVQIDACKPYLVDLLKDLRADRIIVCGTPASKAVTGNTMHPWNHGSWCHLAPLDTRDGAVRPRTLVVAAPEPADAMRNVFVAKIFRQAVQRAIKFDPPEDLPRAVHAYVCENPADVAAFRDWALSVEWLSYDVEWEGVPYNNDFSITSLSFAHPDWDIVWSFHGYLKSACARAAIKEVLTTVPIVAQSIAAELAASELEFGVEIEHIHGDTLPGFKLLNVDSKGSLEALAYYIGYNSHKAEMAEAMALVREAADAAVPEGVGGASYMSYIMGLVDGRTQLRYNALDTFVTGELHVELERRLALPATAYLRTTYDSTIKPGLKLLHRINKAGFDIDRRALDHTRKILREDVVEIDRSLKEKGLIDANSIPQLRDYLTDTGLFEKLTAHLETGYDGKKVDKHTYERKLSKYQSQKTGVMSTGRATLDIVKQWDETGVIATLIDYREKTKLLGSYGDTLATYIRDDGRIHPYYRLDGAKSGRLSSNSPSSHQVPKHGKHATLIKSVYTVPHGFVLISLDYKTLEVFVAAILSGDEAMMDACRGSDFHLETAKKMAPYAWGCTAAEVEMEVLTGTKAKRTAAKGITFSILYGAGAFALADTLKCTIEVAQTLIDAYYTAYPQFARWVKEQHAFAATYGYVTVPWLDQPSRLRPLLHAGYVGKDERGRFNQAMRQAVNTRIQGCAAQYGLLSAIDLDMQFRRDKLPAEVVALVHDSNMVRCRESVMDEVIARMYHAMTSLPTGTDLRLQVDAEAGENWGSLEPIDLIPIVGKAA